MFAQKHFVFKVVYTGRIFLEAKQGTPLFSIRAGRYE